MYLENIDDNFKNNKEVVLTAVKQNGMALQFVPIINKPGRFWGIKSDSGLRSDKDVVITAIKQNNQAFQFASEKLRDDSYIYYIASTSYNKSRNEAMKKNNASFFSIPDPIKYASERIKEEEQIRENNRYRNVQRGMRIQSAYNKGYRTHGNNLTRKKYGQHM
jgi:hypothetical protein